MNLITHLQQLFHLSLKGLVADPAPYSSQIKPAQNPQHGDYQANCAMSLAKHLGQKPRDVAQRIVESLPPNDLLETPEIAGPGFINLRLKKEWLASQLQKIALDERLGVESASKPLTYIIDYSSPNVAKPMHVGHLRSSIIGDALKRLLRFLGHKVIGDNHLGDWGTQMGMILWGWKNNRNDASYEEDAVGELARLYRMAARLIKPFELWSEVNKLEREGKKNKAAEELKRICADLKTTPEGLKSLAEEGRPVHEASMAETAKLHKGDPENRGLWYRFMPQCLAALNKVYERLDIQFDKWLGESVYDEMMPGVVADLQAKGLAIESNGALIVEVEGVPAPFMVRKRDGAFNYATSDLATIKYRQEHFKPDVLLYVVDHRQGDHFKSLFDVAKRWGYGHLVMEHIGFGTIMGKDKKPYKTRDGDVIGLESLLDEAVSEARKVVDDNSKDLPTEERASVAEIVGLGAVKYADLSQNRTSDYVFDWDKMLAMDGNTATYMQYAYARNRAIFRKGGVNVKTLRDNPPVLLLDSPEERALAAQLPRFQEALELAASEYKPNLITAYLWDLARAYSTFYEKCPIFKEPCPPASVQQSRLMLCDLTARVLQCGLDLLGIRTVERM